jgi:hypothetical protein
MNDYNKDVPYDNLIVYPFLAFHENASFRFF